MASKKISQLPLATQVDGDDIIPLVQAGVSKKTTAQDIADLAGSTYLVYTALLTQSGTSAPVATVVENTLDAALEWQYNSPGNYTLTSVNTPFTSGKTLVYLTSGDSNIVVAWSYQNTSNIQIFTASSVDAIRYDESMGNNTTIKIEVYP